MDSITKILIAEHDPIDLELLHYELKTSGINYTAKAVHSEKEYINALKNFIPDIILSDYTFPSFDGPSALKLREKIAPDTPFIFVSGAIGEEKSIELIKTGVTDYALKDKLFTIVVKIKRALKEAQIKKQTKLAEEQMEFDRNNLNALINNTNDLMWSVDKDFNLITSNQPFDNMIKLMTGKVFKKGADFLAAGFSSERLNQYKISYERAFAGEIFTEIEYTQSPVESWSEISYYPIRKGGDVIGSACHSRDITERKKTALKLEQQNNELIKTHAELDHFVHSTTHDLRSPLNSILGLTNLIEEESKELHTLEHVKLIRRNVNRLDKFIKDILNYEQNNHTELTIEAVAMQKITKEIVHSLHNVPGAEGINFKVDIDEEQPFYSDIWRVGTVLENLISNAVKYHKQDVPGRYITITGRSYKEYLHLCIEDNGIGIEPAYHDKIFNMFFRLPSKVTGSGFGLYIVKETIEKLGGSLEVDSEKGRGTAFIIKMKNFLPTGINTI